MTLNIGEKLDTIAQLLAGAPPGPEEKFLFQKYVYCKEDYTSWVVSLLGDLGITYMQVDSLANGLYEYRCECTNDAFNQVILKVELSTNPVLATYKKIDNFSDLVGINVFDMDSYAAGCDSRVSKSDTVTEDMIKYWINVQNDQIVQRQLDLAGSANIGTYSIDFTSGNVISGSVPVNGSIRDNILYRKQITGSAFDYSLTNCTIEGWIVDVQKRAGDLSKNGTITCYAGGINPTYFVNDEMNTYYDLWDVCANGCGGTLWQVEFDTAINISEIHAAFKYYVQYDNTYLHVKVSTNGTDWTTVWSGHTPGNNYIFLHETTGWNNIKFVQFYGQTLAGRGPRLLGYDLSIFS